MIYVTGDIHGHVKKPLEDIERFKMDPEKDIYVLLGDVGVNYYGHGMGDEGRKRALNRAGIKFLCIHGNHEMRPETIQTYDEKPWNGGTVYVEEEFPNLLFAKDGSIYDIEGLKCVALGGAYSVDKYVRIIRGGKWFPDEQPSDEIKKRAEENLAAANWKVDIVFSHTCPEKAIPTFAFLPGVDQSRVDRSTEQWLDTIENKLEYHKWYCGHWHLDGHDYNNKIVFLFNGVVSPQQGKGY